MIGYLKGMALRLTTEEVLLDVSGVGYLVHIPLSTYYELEGRGEGQPVELYIHTHLREDALTLFGFLTEEEKSLFERLIAISGIGPRLARNILSGSTPQQLVSALAAGDVARLTKTPGVGKKTAERIVLELKDKVQELAAGLPEPLESAPSVGDDLVSALVNLGYRPNQAERAVKEAREDMPEAEFHELLRASLKRLARL
ncbi:MAG: Holliday junction branch migration protein RuvA [Acidobacteriota bacterium]|nr:Holliday junction branch migration protein RuvA [Acidobacteriota bacterium]